MSHSYPHTNRHWHHHHHYHRYVVGFRQKFMAKYVNKTMQMSGTTRHGTSRRSFSYRLCSPVLCPYSTKLEQLRQLALSRRIPSSSLMWATPSQASYNNKQPRRVRLQTSDVRVLWCGVVCLRWWWNWNWRFSWRWRWLQDSPDSRMGMAAQSKIKKREERTHIDTATRARHRLNRSKVYLWLTS